MYFKINLWEEKTFSFGDGINKLFDTLWTFEKIKSLCYNFYILNDFNLKEINQINIVKRKDGMFYINQISGYNNKLGLFGFLVNPDNSLKKFI